ncbi:MAG: hypothetical protein JWP12_1914 [Bacteroidetes bacterium]|nr:hypothetical protein [Bacteroidota bacterium]
MDNHINSFYIRMKITTPRSKLLAFVFLLVSVSSVFAQVSYNAAAIYSIRKVAPNYGGKPIQVRRTCDNAVKDIPFTSCGDLDTVALKTFVVAANPLSSITAASAAAYSLRRLSCSYAGNAIQVRRSSDNATQNIGFNAWGDLDTAALRTFVGANSAFVTIWYDQSGNARNATQAVTTLQPRIMNAGVIERQGGMPAIRWLGIGYALATASFTAYGSAACYNAVAKVNANTTTGYNTTVNKCTANFPAPLDLYNAQLVIGSGPSYTFFSMSQTFDVTQSYAIWTYQASSGGSVNAYKNSTNICTGSVVYYGDIGTPLVLGSRADILTGLDGWMSEVITFAVLPSATERAFVEWTQGQYYNLSGAPALGTIPPGAPSGYIATWYDQSGNSVNAVQATIANQPRIINVGVIEKDGTKTALHFGGASQNLTVATPVTSYPASISVLGNTAGASTNGAFVKLGATSGSGGIGIGIGNSGGNFDAAGTSLIGLKEFQVWCASSPNVNFPSSPFTVTQIQQTAVAGSGMTAFLNGTNVPLASAGNVTDGSTLSGNLFIGGYNNGTSRFPVMKQSEVIVYGSALSVTRRTLQETNQAAYYSLTISNNKYTPPASGYRFYVTGVGRETVSDSVAATRSSAGMGFIVGQSGTDFLKDNGDYITAGMDCPVPSSSTSNLPATVTQRWTNDWYIHKTDVSSNNGTITIYFDYSEYGVWGLPGIAANYVLLDRSTPSGTFAIVAGTTPSVSGNRVLFSVDAANITTDRYYTIGTKNIALSPLPIELLEFKAEACDKDVCLNWSTATETNNDFFTIEKTANGTDFETVTTVDGAGNSTQRRNYTAMDHAPYEGKSYYRLKQTDFNGHYTYSGLEDVAFTGTTDFSFEVFPNPNAGENIQLAINTSKGEEILVVVYDATGRESYSKVIITDDNSDNVFAMDPSGKLKPGIYFITATSKQAIYSKRMIVQ